MSKVTIASVSMNLIATMKNSSNQEILNEVKKVFPNAKTSLNSIAWYKSDMKKSNYKVLEVKERTLEVIQNELEETKLKVLMLEEEMNEIVSSQENEEMKMLEELAKKYNKSFV